MLKLFGWIVSILIFGYLVAFSMANKNQEIVFNFLIGEISLTKVVWALFFFAAGCLLTFIAMLPFVFRSRKLKKIQAVQAKAKA